MPRGSLFGGWTVAQLILMTILTTTTHAYAPNFITKLIQEQQTTGLVTTRFPPEPNGYLHLGHAKAVSFNFAVARMFGGVCHMRLDDTNPTKEDQEYVDSILQDVQWIQTGLYDEDTSPWHGPVRQTSSYFDIIYECATALIQSGDAYVDSLTADEMKEYRGTLTTPGRNSPYRERTVEENLQLFRQMRDGDFPDGTHVLRAKLDMASANLNLRDPTLYRIKHATHQATGDDWCIYPMYDFSHPIADAVEGITHSLCTLEFEDHRPFYDWTVQKLWPTGLLARTAAVSNDSEQPPHQPPQQIEFSRLNIKSTVLSKRKLIQLVDENHVAGWDDPRLPTLSGLRRRGVPPSALRLFCERVGISKADSNMDYTVLEDCIREVMDAETPRAFCVLDPLKVTITNWNEHHDGDALEDFVVDRHPKLTHLGQRTVPFGRTVYIERSDFFDTADGAAPPKGFKRLTPGGQVRLRYAYVVDCHTVVRDPATGQATELQCTYRPDTKAGVTPDGMARVKGIIHWVEATTAVPCKIQQYDRLFAVDEPGKESGDFLQDLNPQSLQVLEQAVVEPSVADQVREHLAECQAAAANKKDKSTMTAYPSQLAYQFERSGYFAVDPDTVMNDGDDSLVLNRVVTLRDTWGAPKTPAAQRTRGNNNNQEPKAANNGPPVEDIRRVAFRAATVLSAEPHPEAESLLVCQVDCGDDEPRTVVAGLAGKIPLEELVGSHVVAVTNLKPARVRGVESTAMLLAASADDRVELLQVPAAVPNGELLSFQGKPASEPDGMLKSKGAIKAWERAKAGLRSTSENEAAYLDRSEVYRMMSSEGPITTATLAESVIQ